MPETQYQIKHHPPTEASTRGSDPSRRLKRRLQTGLGHKSASETLDAYPHLWPDDDRTREAVDDALGGNLADDLRIGTLSAA